GSSSVTSGDWLWHALRVRGPVYLAGRRFRCDHSGPGASHLAEPEEFAGQGPELRDRRGDRHRPVAPLPGPLLRLRASLPHLRCGGGFPLSVGGDLPGSRALRFRGDGYFRAYIRRGTRLRLEEGGPPLGL
ncbi:MAG: NADH ubiquinone oxidoreductase chain A, partial [uncultured Rubrobacteraceae bacterium]